MKQFKKLLLIGGAGKNTGKTTLACKIIEKFKEYPVVGIKIARYKSVASLKEKYPDIPEQQNYLLVAEDEMNGKTDSSRMLVAGAKDSFYIACPEPEIFTLFSKIVRKYDNQTLFVVESNSLGRYLEPGLTIFVKTIEKQPSKPKNPARKDALQFYNETEAVEDLLNRMYISNNQWNLKTI